MGRKIYLIFVLSCFSLYGQIFQPPIPNKDVDSLINSIDLLRVYKRASVEMAIKISIEVDKYGKTQDINWFPFFRDSLSKTDKKFIIKLLPKLKTINWTPAKNDGESIPITYTIPIILFTITDQSVLKKYYSEKKNKKISISLSNNNYHKPIILINKSSIVHRSSME